MNGLWLITVSALLAAVVAGLIWERLAAPHDERPVVPPYRTPAWHLAAEPLERARLEACDLWPYEEAVDRGIGDFENYLDRRARGDAL